MTNVYGLPTLYSLRKHGTASTLQTLSKQNRPDNRTKIHPYVITKIELTSYVSNFEILRIIFHRVISQYNELGLYGNKWKLKTLAAFHLFFHQLNAAVQY
jgi:hypothetical protein